LIRTQPATVSPDPSTVTGDVTEIIADAAGKLPGQICDSNAAADVANQEMVATTTNPTIIAFVPLPETAIFKLNLTRGEQNRCARVIKILRARRRKSSYCCNSFVTGFVMRVEQQSSEA